MSLFHDLRPVSRQQDGHLRLLPKTDYGFARKAVELPVHIFELQWLVAVLPLAFRLDGADARLVALTGLEKDRNACVGRDGTWLAATKPAVLESYPFTITKDPRGNHVLAADRASDLLSEQDGEALMNADGSPTDVLAAYNKELQRQGNNRTVMAPGIRALDAAGVLKPLSVAGSDFIDGTCHYYAELKDVRSLSSESMAGLCENFALEMAYAQAYSLPNIRTLRQVADAQAAPTAELGSAGLRDDDDDAPLDFSLLD